jgi:hypothetical protein
LTIFYRRAFSREFCIDGELLLLSRLVEQVGPRGQRVYSEWTQPQGISEMMQTVVLRKARRLAVFGTNRHWSNGVLTDHELAVVRPACTSYPACRLELSLCERVGLRNGVAHGKHQPESGSVKDEPHLIGRCTVTRHAVRRHLTKRIKSTNKTRE